jgi:hypothetical protein
MVELIKQLEEEDEQCWPPERRLLGFHAVDARFRRGQ